jgi:hypothetical protein
MENGAFPLFNLKEIANDIIKFVVLSSKVRIYTESGGLKESKIGASRFYSFDCDEIGEGKEKPLRRVFLVTFCLYAFHYRLGFVKPVISYLSKIKTFQKNKKGK